MNDPEYILVRELQNENIIINFTDNQELYISRALSPAKISMNIDTEEKSIVYLNQTKFL